MASSLPPSTSMIPPPYIDNGQFDEPAPAYMPYDNYSQPKQPKSGNFIGPPPPPSYEYDTGFYSQQPVFIQQSNATSSSFYPGSGYPANAVPMTYSGRRLVPVRPVAVELVPVRQNFSGHMAFACVVFCCCGWVCGAIAFVLAAIASYSSSEGRSSTARSLGRASIFVAVIGLLIGLVTWGYVIWSVMSKCSHQYSCHGSCYDNVSAYYSKTQCSSMFSSSCFDNGRCYYSG